MRKRIASVLAMIIVFTTMLANTTYAADSSTASVTLSYTVSSNYTINIPSTLSINDSKYITITGSNINLEENERLQVYLDADKTFAEDGNFYLYKNKGETNEESILCYLGVGRYEVGASRIYDGEDTLLAAFRNGDTTAYYNGCLTFFPNTNSGTKPGTYTGAVYFKILISTVS